MQRQLWRQGQVVHHLVLGKQVELLEYQAKVQAVFANLFIGQGGGVVCVDQRLSVHGDGAAAGGLQKVQAPQQGGLAATGGADDHQHIALFQRKVNAFEHLGIAKALLQILNF